MGLEQEVANVVSELKKGHGKSLFGALTFVRTNLIKSINGRSKLVEAGAVKLLLVLVGDKARHEGQAKMADIVMSIMANLCLDSIAREQILKFGGLETIANFTMAVEQESLQNRGVRALANLAQSEVVIEELYNLEVPEFVAVRLLETEDDECRVTYCRAIRQFGKTTMLVRRLVEDTQAVQALATMIKLDTRNLVLKGMRTLAEFTSKWCCQQLTAQILAAKVLEEMVTYAEDADNDMAHFSLTLVCKLCEQGIIRPALGAAGAVTLLVRLMSSTRPHINHVSVLNTLCLCSKDSVNRNRIRDSGGLEVFVSALKDGNSAESNFDNVPKRKKRKFSVLYDRVISCLVNFIYHDGCLDLLQELGLVDVLLAHLQRCCRFTSKPGPDFRAELQKLSQAFDVEIEQDIVGHEDDNTVDQEEPSVQEGREVETKDEHEPGQVEANKSNLETDSKIIYSHNAETEPVTTGPKQSSESLKTVTVSEEEISKSALGESISNQEIDRQEEEILSQNILSRDPLNIDNQVLCGMSQSAETDTQPVIDDSPTPGAGPSSRSSKHTFSINSPSYQSESSWRMEDYNSGVTCINFSNNQPSPAQLLSPASYRSSPYSPLSADLSYYSPTHSLCPTYSRPSLTPPQALQSPYAGFSPSLTMSDLSSVQTSPYASPHTDSSIGPFSPLSTAELSVPLSPITTSGLSSSPLLNFEEPEESSDLPVSELNANILVTEIDSAISTQSNLSIPKSPAYSTSDEEDGITNHNPNKIDSVNTSSIDFIDGSSVKTNSNLTNNMSPISSMTGENLKSISDDVNESVAISNETYCISSVVSTLKNGTASKSQSMGDKFCSYDDFKTTENPLSFLSRKRFKLSPPSEGNDNKSDQVPSTSGQNSTANLGTEDLSVHSETYMRRIVPRSSKLSKKLQRFVSLPGPENPLPVNEASFKKRGSQPQPKASTSFQCAEDSVTESIFQSSKRSPHKCYTRSPRGEKDNQSVKKQNEEEVELSKPEDFMSDVDNAENKDRPRRGENERRNKILRMSESNILILLSTLSVKPNHVGVLVEAKATVCLLQYLRDSPAPLQRCCRILTRLFGNPLIFRKLIVHQIPAFIVKNLILQKDGTFPAVMFCAEWENQFGQIQHSFMNLTDLIPSNQTSDMDDASHITSGSQASDFGRKLEFEFGSDAYSRAKSLRSDTPSVHRLFRYLYHDSPSLSVDSQSARDEASVSNTHREDVIPPGSDRKEALVRVGLGLLRSLSAVALSSYGEGEIQHLLRRGSEGDVLACRLSLMHLPIPWGKMTRQQLAIKYHSSWKVMLPCLFMDAAPLVVREAILVMLSFSLHLDVPAKKTVKLLPIAPCPDVSLAESATQATGMDRMLSDAAAGSQSPVLFDEEDGDQANLTNLRSQNCPYWDKASSHDMFLVIKEKTITIRYGCDRAVMMRKSEVFAAMLGGAYAERSKAEIELTDTKAGSFECILHYLHGCTNNSCPILESLTAFNTVSSPHVKDNGGWDSPRSEKDADTGLRCCATNTIDQEPISVDVLFSQEVNCEDSQGKLSVCSNSDQVLESSDLASENAAANLLSNNPALIVDSDNTPTISKSSKQTSSAFHDSQGTSDAPEANVARADAGAKDLPTPISTEKNQNIEKALLSLEELTDHCVEVLALADRFLLSELVSHISQILSHICLHTHTWEELLHVACFYKLPCLAQDCLREALLANQPLSDKAASLLDLSTRGHKEHAIEALNKLFNLN